MFKIVRRFTIQHSALCVYTSQHIMTVGIYLLKVNDRSTRTKFGFVGFIANFEHISHLCSSVSIANFEHVIASCDDSPLLYGCLYSSLFMVIMVGQFTIYYCTGHDMKAMVF